MKPALLLLTLLASQPFNQDRKVITEAITDGPGIFKSSHSSDLDYTFNCGMKSIHMRTTNRRSKERGFHDQDESEEHGIKLVTINGSPVDTRLIQEINNHLKDRDITRAWGMCSPIGARIGIQYQESYDDVQALEIGIKADGSGHLLQYYQNGQWQPLTAAATLEQFTDGMQISREQRIRYLANCPREISNAPSAYQPTELHTLVVNWQDENTGLVRGRVLQADMDGHPVGQRIINRLNRRIPKGASIWPINTLCHSISDFFYILFFNTLNNHEQAAPWDFTSRNPSGQEINLEFNNRRQARKVRTIRKWVYENDEATETP
ncbi:MAG: hypothetical protein Q4B94_10985 [Pseudomonadota bacterium]|nr:hypothetical protein [Pseudomonadota bacterium]